MKMSLKKLLLVTVIGFWSLQASANNLGVEAGLNFSSISFTPTQAGLTGGTKFTGGVYYEMKVEDWFYFQPGLRFNGYSASASGSTASSNVLQVPLLGKAKFATGSMVTPFALAGLVPGFEISESQTNVTNPNNFKGFSLGLSFGGGAEFEVSPGVALLVSGRYTLGLLNQNNATTNPSVTSVKASGFELLVGGAFAL